MTFKLIRRCHTHSRKHIWTHQFTHARTSTCQAYDTCDEIQLNKHISRKRCNSDRSATWNCSNAREAFSRRKSHFTCTYYTYFWWCSYYNTWLCGGSTLMSIFDSRIRTELWYLCGPAALGRSVQLSAQYNLCSAMWLSHFRAHALTLYGLSRVRRIKCNNMRYYYNVRAWKKCGETEKKAKIWAAWFYGFINPYKKSHKIVGFIEINGFQRDYTIIALFFSKIMICSISIATRRFQSICARRYSVVDVIYNYLSSSLRPPNLRTKQYAQWTR